MTSIARVLVLVLIFAIDVRLSAETVFYPRNCWGKDNCAVQNDARTPAALHLKTLSLHMDSQAIVKSISEKEGALTKGTLLARHEGEYRWQTPFGDIVCDSCEILLQRDDRRVEVHAIKGSVAIVRKGDGSRYDLPPGFSVELSKVEHDGRADLGFPQASPLLLVGKEWAKLHSEDEHEFKKEFGAYVETWQTASDLSSDMQRQAADRSIASSEAEQKRLDVLRERRLKEQQRLRDLFKQKNDLQ